MLREMHALLMRAVGAESESALAVAYDLAQSLSGQRKYVDSERPRIPSRLRAAAYANHDATW